MPETAAQPGVLARGRAARRPGARVLPWAAALLAAALLLGAGGPAARAEDHVAELSIRDHRFEPAEIEVPAGRRIKLIVKNLDASAEEFESLDLRREKIVAAKSQIVVYIGPLSPGRYEFFGDFHPDTARGHITAK